jgi:hypothetical protein
MRPSLRIDQLAKRYIQQAEKALASNEATKNLQLDEPQIAIILSRAIADYLDEEWQKKPNVVLQ